MAMDENPTVKEGQSWSSWADIVGFRNSENEEEEEDAGKEKNWKKRRENDAMKLRKEEMGLFGYCPTWDDFFLVVCELCGRVVKPQAFSGHLECRHGNSSCHSSRETSVSSSNPQPQPHHHGSNKNSSGGSGSHTSSHGSASNPPSQQQRSSANSTVPLVPSSSGNRSNSSGSIYSNQSGAKSSPNPNALNNSQSAGSNTKISNARTNHHNSMSSNNNQSSKLSSSRQISTSSSNPSSANSNAKSSTARQNSSSSNTRQNLAPNNNQNSKPSARSSNPVPISNANASSSGNNTPEHSNTAKSKSDSKSDSRSSKKNHAIIDPVVRVERMPSSVVMKKTTTDSPSSVNSGDRRERSASPQVINTESNTNLDLEHVRASPARNQVLYEGTSGPGPGNFESSQNLGQRKIAQSSKSDASVKKTNVGTGSAASLREGHAGTMSAPTMGAVNRKPSKSKKASKERKQLLCKDREYDANKHCGVVIAESGKHCTRSLTCKTHSLSLRRAVIGRKKHFDELLSEHRAAKESQLKNPVSQAPATALRSNPQPSASHNSDPEKIGSSKGNPSAAIVNLKRVLASGRVSKTAQDAGAPPTSTSTHNPPIQRLPSCRVTSDSGNSGSHASGNSDASKSPNLDKNHSVQRSDLPYLSHHPRPAAMCSFGIRRLGCGVFLTNRYLDATRSALEMAFLHHKGNQVPPKKLCADASSLLPLHDDPLMETNNDPYSFTRLDLSGVNESEGSSLASPPIYTEIKPISSNNSVLNSATMSSAKTNPSILPNNKLSGNATSPNSATQSLAASNTSAVKRTSNKSKLANAVNKLKRLKSCEEKTTSNCASSPTSSPISPQTPSAAKKRRTSVNSNPNNPSNSNLPISNRQVSPAAGAQTLTLTALTSANLRNNSAMAAHQSSRSIPLSFPLTIGERLGALSRLNVTSSPFVNRNNVAIAPAILRNNLSGVPNHGSNSPLKDNVFLTGVDVINGQIPVTSALLHSVTVSRASDSSPTTLTPGIALGHNSLVNQLSRFQQNLTSNNHQRDLTNSNKPGANSALTSGGAKGNKCKSRKSSRSNSGAQLQSQPNSSRGVFGSPLNLGLSLLLDGGPGAISSAHVSSSSVGLQHSSGSSPSDGSSPQLRMESLSPGMSSPTVNGRGPSPCGNLPPLFTPSKNAFGSGTVTSTTISGSNVRLSPASRTNTPSPDSLSTNHFSQHLTKGKSKHVSSYPKPVTPLNVVAAAAQHHSNLSFPVTPPVGGSTSASAASITYQQVFASQMLTQAQLNQFQAFHSPTAVPTKNNKNIASKSNSVAAGSIPLKILAATSSASSQGTQHRHLLLSDDSRRKDLDSHSLST